MAKDSDLRTKERVGFKTGVFGVVEPAKTIREDDATVRIALYKGILPEAPSECAALGENTSLLLTTRSPIETQLVVQR